MKRSYAFGLALSLVLTGAFLIQKAGSANGKVTAQVTFSKDVAPIIFNNCAGCHQPGETAPMALLNYKQARPWAKSIREVVANKTMPPWYADPKHGEFINDRSLSQKDIDTIVAWVDQGATEGNAKDLPAAPKLRQEGWAIGKPDVEFPLPQSYKVPTDGTVDYQHFVVHTKFTEDKFIQAAEIKRGNAALVHHVIVTVIEPVNGQLPPEGLLTRNLGGLGENQQRTGNASTANANRNRDSMLVGWAPGMSPLTLQPGIAKRIKKGSALVFQMHYTTNGVPGEDRTSIGMKFASAPVEKQFITSGGASARELVIPPNAAHYESKSSFTFTEDAHIWGFMPHMHLRGKDYKYTLVLPDGTSKVVLNVPKYDFNWQLNYWVKAPIAAPKGSRLECVAHHDNSTANKFNPDPTKEVRWGPQTWEEMMIGWFDYTLDGQNLRVTASNK
ncbi:MAG: c-type cytochrome [Blastocatellia bacterium]